MRVALYQSCTGIDPEANARGLITAVEEAAAGGAAILFTPEMSNLLDGDRERARPKLRVQDEDPVLAAVRSAASRHGLWVALGSIAVRSGDDEARLSNRSVLIDDTGSVRATYDKIHLFDAALATGERWRESAAYRPGEGAVVARTPHAMLGLSICYDLRFPALYAALAAAGAAMIAVPAAFTVPTGSAHWHVLLRARAIETQAFVIAAAQSGHHADGRTTYGYSLVVDPWGTVLLDMGTTEGVGFADIDFGEVAAVRARMPVLEHRRAIGSAQVVG